MEIAELLDWSAPKRVDTRRGPRMLRKAEPTKAFWAAWRQAKEDLKAAGVSISKRNGSWEACWWQTLDEETKAAIAEAVEASRATDADVEIPTPEGLELLPYQRAGVAYALARSHTLIGDEMGLGKTVQAIALINADPSIRRALVLCPASLRINWARELRRWLTRELRVLVVDGGKAEAWPAIRRETPAVVIANYDIISKHRSRIDSSGPWDLVVADEAHYLKSPKAARTRAVLGGKATEPIAARRWLYLSGTPILNRPIELWPIVRHAGLWRSWRTYVDRYCGAVHDGYGWDVSGATHLDELQERLRERLMVRRLKKDVLSELPPKRRQVIEIPANGLAGLVDQERSAVEEYEERVAAARERVELAKVAGEDDYRAAIEAMREASTAAFTEVSRIRHQLAVAKVPAVCDHLEEALTGGPVVLFAHHRDVLAAIAERFSDRAVVVHGGVSLEERQRAVDRFQAGEADLFVGQTQAAGVGLTLTASSHVVFAELDWVPAMLSQAEDRCHRIGQEESVLVQHLVVDGSLDATMAHRIVAKQAVIDAALDDLPDEDEELTPAREVPATVELRPDAVAKEAEGMRAEEIDAIHRALRHLAASCDGARALDGAGFSKIDTRIGHSLARCERLTPRQAVLGKRIARRYRRQLTDELALACTEPRKEEAWT